MDIIFFFKGTVGIISSEPPFLKGHAGFTMVFYKKISDPFFWRYHRTSNFLTNKKYSSLMRRRFKCYVSINGYLKLQNAAIEL